MTGRNSLPTTAAGVVDTIKQVWCLAVVVVAVHSACNIFGVTFINLQQQSIPTDMVWKYGQVLTSTNERNIRLDTEAIVYCRSPLQQQQQQQ